MSGYGPAYEHLSSMNQAAVGLPCGFEQQSLAPLASCRSN